MMKKRSVFWYILVIAIIIGVGTCLTNVLVALLAKNNCVKYQMDIDKKEILQNGDKGEVFIQNSYSADDIGFEFVVNGGAFLETFQDNSKREVHLLLKNLDDHKIIYRINTDLYARPDLYIHKMAQFHLNEDFRYGFYTAFSPATIRDGLYEAYIEVNENELDKGIFYTGVVYQKENRSFTEQQFFSFLPDMAMLFGEQLNGEDMRAHATGISVNREMNFAWSSGWNSVLHLSACDHTENDLLCHINIISLIKVPQRVKILCEDEVLFDEDIFDTGEISFTIPKTCISDNSVELVFNYPNAIIPKEEGINEDPRRIAIAFNSIKLENVG